MAEADISDNSLKLSSSRGSSSASACCWPTVDISTFIITYIHCEKLKRAQILVIFHPNWKRFSMACYILELWLHAEMLKLENVSTELWSESWGKNYLLCGCAQLSSRVRSAFAEVQQSFYWSNLNIMVACSREIHLIFQIFSTRKKYINVIKDRFNLNDLYIFHIIHFHHYYWGQLPIFVVSKIYWMEIKI